MQYKRNHAKGIHIYAQKMNAGQEQNKKTCIDKRQFLAECEAV